MSYQQQVFSFISSIIGQNNIIPIPIEFVRFTGDYPTAVLLSQLIYWQGKQRDPDGWIWKTYDQWESELALSKYQVSRASKALVKMGILETKVARVRLENMLGDRAVHYRLINDKFIDLFGRHLSIVESEIPSLSKVKEFHSPKSSNLTFLSNEPETTIKKNDNEPKPPKNPKPTSTKASSSFSSDDLSRLLETVPLASRSKQVEARLRKALKQGVTVSVLSDAIAYTTDHAPKDYAAYLGLSIDKEYATDGYRHQHEERAAIKKQELEQAEEIRRKEQAEESTRKEEANRINGQLDEVTANGQLDGLDSFIDGQPLNDIERSMFKRGKVAMLRRRFVEEFLTTGVSAIEINS